MSDESDNESRNSVPLLNMRNWNTSFKDAFTEHCYRYGKVALILTNERDQYRDVQDISFNMMVDKEVVVRTDKVEVTDLVLPDDPNIPLKEGTVRVMRKERKYANDRSGREEFREDKREIDNWINGKMKIMSKLLRKMDRDVKETVITHPSYEALNRKCDLLGLWQLTRTTALGRGAVSVYQLTLRLINLKQTESYAKYAKEFVAAAQDLQRQGSAEEILKKVLNTLFVIGLNQEQFKDKLTPIYGSHDWPDHEVLVSDLHTYSEAMRSMEDIKDPEKREGKITGYAAETSKNGCWNCGQSSHIRRECDQPQSKCENCGMLGHLTKYCLRPQGYGATRRHQTKPQEPKQRTSRDTQRSRERSSPKKKKTNHKSERRKKQLRKATAYHSKVDNSDYSSSEEEHSQIDEQSESSASSIEAYMLTTKKSDAANEKIIIDTACKGAHVLTPDAKQLIMNAEHQGNEIFGIGGNSLKANIKGQLGKANLGRAVIAAKSDANLLSLMTLLQKTDGSFDGNANTLNIRDRNGNVMIRAKEDDGFWKCSHDDIASIRCYLNDVHDESEDDNDEPPEEPAAQITHHCTAEERQRALQCQDLCRLLAHPGHEALMKALDRGNFTDTSLTSQDVRNMLLLFGPCKECLEGKMSADRRPKTSLTEPARSVGECIHSDIIPLEGMSLGGHTQLLVSVCEKSGYVLVNPLKTKSTKDLCDAFEAVISHFRTYGHTVKRIHTDHERNMKKCEVFLGNRGVEYIAMPANHHEVLAERTIRVLRDRFRALIATLPYELPRKLEAEAFVACADGINKTPRKRSGIYTPYQLVQHRRPVIPRYYFGQTGLFHRRRSDSPETRAEWGIFLSQGSGPRSLRAFLPMRQGVYSMMKFIPHAHYPSEWKLQDRIRVKTAARSAPATSMRFTQKGESSSAAAPATKAMPVLPHPSPPLPPPSPQSVQTIEAPPPAPTVSNIHATPDSKGALAPGDTATCTPISAPDKHHNDWQDKKGATKTVQSPTEAQKGDRDSSPHPTTPHPRPDTRPRRHTTDWKDGPARMAGLEIETTNHQRTRALLTDLTSQSQHESIPIHTYRVSLRKALEDPQHRKAALKAVHDEIENMEKNEVVKPIKYVDVPSNARSKIIPVFMFLKDKYKADGSFDKIKARLVANGAAQHADDVGETFSPTCNPISFFTQVNITASRKAHLSSYDIKGAFLLAKITNGKRIFLRIPRNVAEHWVECFPSRNKYVERNGSMIVELQRYMYGLQESPHEFNELLTSHLKSMGMIQSTADPSLFFKNTSDGKLILCAHVDDLLLTSPNKHWQQWFEDGLRREFEIVCQYDKLSYLGMTIDYNRSAGIIHVSQTGFAKDLVKKVLGDKGLRKPPSSPATSALVQESENNTTLPMEKTERKQFLSIVMSLMYLARLTRPDILFATTVLATRSAEPTHKDVQHLYRVIGYVSGTIQHGLTFNGNLPIDPAIFADASHGLHFDGRGHGGIVISLGSAPVHCRSFKLKLVTRSTCESELVTLEEGTTYADWLLTLLHEVGCEDIVQIPVYQDNKSTIIIATVGGNFKRTKHMLIRHKFVEEQVKRGVICLRYAPSKEMPADLLTKPQSGSTFENHKNHLYIQAPPMHN